MPSLHLKIIVDCRDAIYRVRAKQIEYYFYVAIHSYKPLFSRARTNTNNP
jgi:hypothetical protein